jgi:hydrogenase nickel incorporation protein HypA/HybF
MHEASIAKRLLTKVICIAEGHAAVAVEAVSVQIGEFTGIEPALLAGAFAQLAVSTLAADASLEIQIVPLTVRCTACHREFAPNGFRFHCERCPGAKVEITGGEELILENVILAQAKEADACL